MGLKFIELTIAKFDKKKGGQFWLLFIQGLQSGECFEGTLHKYDPLCPLPVLLAQSRSLQLLLQNFTQEWLIKC